MRARIRFHVSGTGNDRITPFRSLAAARRQLLKVESLRDSKEGGLVRKTSGPEPSWKRSVMLESQSRDKDTTIQGGEARSRLLSRPILRKIPIFEAIRSFRDWRNQACLPGTLVGLVPTMGALHDGHIDLVRQAARECDHVVVSIYVNPSQFGPNEDLGSYPRTIQEDIEKLRNLNWDLEASDKKLRGKVSAILQPVTEEMYPYGLELGSYMNMNPAITKVLEGKSRPTFFQGVTTVVTKLLNIVQPHKVYFGQKDIQQLVIVQRMIREFHIPTTLRRGRTKREPDGLALSSRNIYLGERRRKVAIVLNKTLCRAFANYIEKQRNTEEAISRNDVLAEALEEAVKLQAEQHLLPPSERALFEIDYISLADPTTLKEVDVVSNSLGAIISGAIVMLPLEEIQPGERLGLGGDQRPVRLIDNLLIGQAGKHLGG